MFYVLYYPSDADTLQLDWFSIHSTRSEAIEDGRDIARGHGWEFVYLSAKNQSRPSDFYDTKTVVVHQTNHFYYGA